MKTDRYLSMFFEEARELLQALEAGLMDLEARRDDRAHLDRTFRAAHTLKGAAGMVGLAPIARFTHGVEAVLDLIRGGKLSVSPPLIGTLLAARDHLAAAVEASAEGRTLDAPPELVDRLAAASNPDTAAAEAIPAETPSPTEPQPPTVRPATRAYVITLTPRRDLLRKGVNPLGMLDELRELGEARITPAWEAVPPLEDLDARDCHLSWSIELMTDAEPVRIEDVFLFLDDRSQVSIEARDLESGAAAGSLRQPTPSAPPPQEPERPAPATEEAREAGARAVAGARIRVDADQLDQLVGMAGELAVLTDSLQGLAELEGAERWVGTLEALERVGRRLRDTTLELRMVPVEELFVRFPRVVRDLGERSGKRIALKIEGEDTRLDRAIIERLADPMVHLIRNAVDHGLETPEERQAAGKPPTGRIMIGAGHEGDRVAIRVEDDGRGLDRAKVVRKGVALGLLPPETSPDDPRVGNLIFEPGFSTRDEAGELSGRGVGLDVVRDTIRGLRGSVSLRSVEGQGTTFLIRLPLTLAMIDGLLVQEGVGRYVVPMGQVEECVAFRAGDSATMMGRRAAIVRGEAVPVVSLRRAFGGPTPEGSTQELLLTRHAEQRVGVAVDRLLGRVQALIQPLDPGLAGLRRFSGATILGDGSVCLILDLPTLVAEAHAH